MRAGREGEVLFRIVEEEVYVRGHPGRLDGGEIGAGDLSGGMGVGEIEAPETSARADVEDCSGGREWGEGGGAIEHDGINVMHYVKAFLFEFVVGNLGRVGENLLKLGRD